MVLANEYDESIAAAYKANHKGTRMIVGDITSLDLEKTFGPYQGQIDVVIGGPPCQGFAARLAAVFLLLLPFPRAEVRQVADRPPCWRARLPRWL